MKTLVFGKTGQVARSLAEFFPEAVFLGRDEANFENRSQVLRALENFRPRLVINAAAYTEVDKAEIEPGRARLINAETPGDIGAWCKETGASLIHFSTDYVYGGAGELPWKETDIPAPLNRYGSSKLAGEKEIAATGCHHIILRSSWIFSAHGKNFLTTMLKLGRERESLSIVNDQAGAPTFARDLARATAAIVQSTAFNANSGIFNLANSGFVNWHGFAEQIFAELRTAGMELKVRELLPIPSSGYPTPARRPLNSRLDTRKIKEIFGIELRPWSEALHECVEGLLAST